MKILLASSDSIALAVMDKLMELGVLGAVLTNPDAPQLRSKTPVPTPIKQRALEKGIPCYQFESLRTEAREAIAKSGCDFLLSFSFGKIFGPRFLALFSHTMNIHPSLLPIARGATPLQAAILSASRSWGISFQQIALGMDEGVLFCQVELSLDGTETVQSLEERVGLLAASSLQAALDNCLALRATEQKGQASYTSLIKSDSFPLDFSMPASLVHATIRAAIPWPKAFTLYEGGRLMVTSVYGGFDQIEEGPVSEAPGQVVAFDKSRGLKVACKDGYIWIDGLQLPTKKAMSARDFANGNPSIKNTRLGG